MTGGLTGEMTGGIWERDGRDENNHSRAETPLYKGDSEDDGRDEDAFQYKVLWKGSGMTNFQYVAISKVCHFSVVPDVPSTCSDGALRMFR